MAEINGKIASGSSLGLSIEEFGKFHSKFSDSYLEKKIKDYMVLL